MVGADRAQVVARLGHHVGHRSCGGSDAGERTVRPAPKATGGPATAGAPSGNVTDLFWFSLYRTVHTFARRDSRT